MNARPAGPTGETVKVLQFLTLLAVGGTERQVLSLALELDPSRFAVQFGCLNRVGDLREVIERSGKPLAEYRINRLYGPHALRRQLQFARDLRKSRIQVVHTYGFWSNVFGIPPARLAGVPLVVAAVRDTCDELTPAQRGVQRLACRLADAIVVNAEAIKHRLTRDGYDAERIVVIPNGVDLSRFRRAPDPGRLRRELGLPADAPLVAVFARLTPVKGIEYFLEAAASVAARFPAARFLVVGDGRVIEDGVRVPGSYERDMKAQAARLGLGDRALFTGLRSDVPELLKEVAVSVLPSLHEGLSNSVLESMAAGVPVVATNIGGIPEAVADGVTGLLVPPRDAGALSQAIGALLADPERAARLGQAGRQRVVERFSNEQMVRRTERFYLEGLAGKGWRPDTRALEARDRLTVDARS
jgi:glycosyltransferase involved in cell wall biosynthesis